MSLPSLRGKTLSIVLIAAMLGAVGTLGYVIATPEVGEEFTEFYILGLDGKATDYTSEVRIGEEGRVIVGIINREHKTVSYRVMVMIDGAGNNRTGPLELGHGEKWEEIVSFTPDRVGETKKVEFLLYKNGGSEPYRKLHLWVDVKE